MNISEPFIRRPVGTSLQALGLFLSGLVAYRFMPVAAIPRVDYPVITVSGSLPGADPATVASSLATPLERRLGQIAGVTEMTSVSTLGGCNVTIQLDLNRKVDDAAHDVQAAINAASTDLPINLPNPPIYRKVNPADAPIMVLALTSDTLPQSQIFEFADSILGQKLSQVDGVSQALIVWPPPTRTSAWPRRRFIRACCSTARADLNPSAPANCSPGPAICGPSDRPCNCRSSPAGAIAHNLRRLVPPTTARSRPTGRPSSRHFRTWRINSQPNGCSPSNSTKRLPHCSRRSARWTSR